MDDLQKSLDQYEEQVSTQLYESQILTKHR